MQQNPPLHKPKDLIAKRYRLEKRLGDGNFGEVWLAHDMRLETQQELGLETSVAIKFLKEEYVNDPEVRADFQSEVRALYRLTHHNLIRLFDFELLPEMAYLVTEYAAGGSLAHQLAKKGRFGTEEVAKILEQVASGLDFAHAQKFVHRDLKPHNLLITSQNRLVIADFGLSQFSNNNSSKSMTQMAPCGTPAYMAPEQWDWFAGPKTDIYALGVIIYQLLTGRLPLRATTGSPREWKQLHQQAPIPSLRAMNPMLPLELDAVIEAAMAKDPKTRASNASELYSLYQKTLRVIDSARKSQVFPGGLSGGSFTSRSFGGLPGKPEKEIEKTGLPRPASNLESVIFNDVTVPLGPGSTPALIPAKPPSKNEPEVSIRVRGQSSSPQAGSNPRNSPASAPEFLDENLSPIKRLSANRQGRTNRTASFNFIPLGTHIKTLQGHLNYVYALAFGPDSNLLASASLDKTIRLWDVESGEVFHILTGHSGAVHSIAFSKNGELLASGSADKTVRFWNTRSGQVVKILQGHNGIVQAVAFSPDGKFLASGSADKTVRLWSTSSWTLEKVLEGHTDNVTSLSFSPHNDGILTGSKDGTIRLWELPGGNEVEIFDGHYGSAVRGVAFSPDGKQFASGSEDKSVRLWSMENGENIKTFRPIGGDTIYGIAYSPNGRLLASASNVVKLRDVTRLIELESVQHGGQLVNAVAFSPDGRLLASGADDRMVKLWSAEQLETQL